MSKNVLLCAALAASVFAVAAYASGGGPAMGPAHTTSVLSFQGFYDGHHVTYLNTDVSRKSDAAAMHINYSARIGLLKGLPEIYLVEGRSAPGQLAVFGSEPGETDYSPLWAETILTWKGSAKPVVIKSDTQVNALEKKGVLTERDGHTVLNCPIIKVGS